MNCPRCNAPNADAANFCVNCGVTLRGAPAAQAPAPGYAMPPYAPPAMPVAPICPMCRSPYLQYFYNGKGACSTCWFIFQWGYLPNGQIALYPNTGF